MPLNRRDGVQLVVRHGGKKVLRIDYEVRTIDIARTGREAEALTSDRPDGHGKELFRVDAARKMAARMQPHLQAGSLAGAGVGVENEQDHDDAKLRRRLVRGQELEDARAVRPHKDASDAPVSPGRRHRDEAQRRRAPEADKQKQKQKQKKHVHWDDGWMAHPRRSKDALNPVGQEPTKGGDASKVKVAGAAGIGRTRHDRNDDTPAGKPRRRTDAAGRPVQPPQTTDSEKRAMHIRAAVRPPPPPVVPRHDSGQNVSKPAQEDRKPHVPGHRGKRRAGHLEAEHKTSTVRHTEVPQTRELALGQQPLRGEGPSERERHGTKFHRGRAQLEQLEPFGTPGFESKPKRNDDDDNLRFRVRPQNPKKEHTKPKIDLNAGSGTRMHSGNIRLDDPGVHPSHIPRPTSADLFPYPQPRY